jgi:hypothetical protein
MVLAETSHSHATPASASSFSHNSESRWFDACARFLRAISARQRNDVAHRLEHPNNGGSGLREWVASIAWRGAVLPAQIPESVIHVYLSDPEAAPLFDCEGCGLLIPVRPSRFDGWDGEPDEVYFTSCPLCESRTGQYLYFTKKFEGECINPLRRRPR